jgi:hypothetical protein
VQTKGYIIQGKPTGGLKSILPGGAEEGEVGVHKLREEEEKTPNIYHGFLLYYGVWWKGKTRKKTDGNVLFVD